MNLFKKIKSGELTKDGCVKTLAGYQLDKYELMRNAKYYSPEAFKSKMSEIDTSINLVEILVDKFDEIRDSK